MHSKPARVLLVDDHALYREGLGALLMHGDDFDVAGEASNGLEAIEMCRKLIPDLVLMDVQMPLMDGVEAAGHIHNEFPNIPIVMLTVSNDEDYLFGAIRNGACGYVLKDTHSRQLRDRLRGVLRGEATLSGSIAARVLEEIKLQPSGKGDEPGTLEESKLGATLTDREQDILHLVAQGMSNEEIAAQLFLSTSTVKKQLSAIMQKLHLNNRIQVAVFASRIGLT